MNRFFLLRAYHRANTSSPKTTQIVTTATLMAAGDVIAQKAIEEKDSIDFKRTARFFFIGLIYVGPVLSTWYYRLDRLLPKEAKYRAMKMMAIDQGIFAPIFLPGFLAVAGAVHLQKSDEIIETIKHDAVTVILSNWMLWPAAQVINFNFVPLPYRILFASGIALFWNIYLSWMSNQGVQRATANHPGEKSMADLSDNRPE
ncbi:protein Mpv17 isoform X2 [Galendromus occidentalis]|nr:protein Mpv17 isoform X2 [Galendromus occidentalis]